LLRHFKRAIDAAFAFAAIVGTIDGIVIAFHAPILAILATMTLCKHIAIGVPAVVFPDPIDF
jgi:hypothetical protein